MEDEKVDIVYNKEHKSFMCSYCNGSIYEVKVCCDRCGRKIEWEEFDLSPLSKGVLW